MSALYENLKKIIFWKYVCKLRIILTYSKKGKVFETFYQKKFGEITCHKNILKVAFSHRLQCKRQPIIIFLIFNILLISEDNL